MKELLLEALKRMDSAKGSIQRETGLGYGILDTADLRETLEKIDSTNQSNNNNHGNTNDRTAG